MSAETWRPIPGFPGYEVSDLGRVLSRRRYRGSDGPRLMSTPPNGEGYQQVHMATTEGGSRVMPVHAVVMLGFVGERPDGHHIRHLDGNPANNTPANLCYGTSSENSFDQVRHGTHPFASRTHCKHGHEYTPENTAIALSSVGRPYRQCKTCNQARAKRQRTSPRKVAA